MPEKHPRPATPISVQLSLRDGGHPAAGLTTAPRFDMSCLSTVYSRPASRRLPSGDLQPSICMAGDAPGGGVLLSSPGRRVGLLQSVAENISAQLTRLADLVCILGGFVHFLANDFLGDVIEVGRQGAAELLEFRP